jgi:hypothetical protein
MEAPARKERAVIREEQSSEEEASNRKENAPQTMKQVE